MEADWDEAYDLITKKEESKNKYGSDAFAASSARYTNEENYLFQKLVRTVLAPIMLIIAPSLTLFHGCGLATTLGNGNMTNGIKHVSETFNFVIGSNTTENNPVIANFMRQAKNAAPNLSLTRGSDWPNIARHLSAIKPGSNIAFNAMMHEIIKISGMTKSLLPHNGRFVELAAHTGFTPEKLPRSALLCRDIKAAQMVLREKPEFSTWASRALRRPCYHGSLNLAMLLRQSGQAAG